MGQRQQQTVLVTGGTRGLGQAIGLEFAHAGARVVLTYKWGSIDEEQVIADFLAEGLPPPLILQSDVGDLEETRTLMQTIREQGHHPDVIVSNVAFSKVVPELSALSRKSFELSLQYSAWPVVDLIQATHEVCGRYPRYVLGISSDGGQFCYPGYDLAGVSKSVLETLCRYLAFRLKPHGVRVNAVRPGLLDTASARATFGEETIDQIQARFGAVVLDPRAVAQVCVALCSGLMDAMTGQVLTVDEGWSLVSAMSWMTGQGIPAGFPPSGVLEP